MERGKRIEINPVDDTVSVDDAVLAFIDIDELIKYWNNALPPLVDYADMVGAPHWAYGCRYVYEDPDGYFIEDTISLLKQIRDGDYVKTKESIVLPHTIGNRTFYTKDELVEWVLDKMNNTMIVDFPYHIEIHNNKDAYNAISNMCSNCHRLHYCTGAEAYKCNEVKEKIKRKFIKDGKDKK